MEFNMDDIDKKLSDIENSLDEWLTDQMLNKSSQPLEIAAILMKNALVIYKTVLPESDFNVTVNYIFENTDQIQSLTPTNLH